MSRLATRHPSQALAARLVWALLGDLLITEPGRAEDAAQTDPLISAPQAEPASTPPVAPPPVSTEADAHYEFEIDTALLEYERSNFQESREHFRRAHQLRPSARTLRGLGKVEFELRNYVEALQHLEAALANTEHPLDAALREEVERLITRTRGYVGTLHLELAPASAALSIDGVHTSQGPQADLALVVGDHLLEFRAQGYLPERRSLRVYGGDDTRIRVSLAQLPLGGSDVDLPRREGLSRAAWWGISVAVVVLAASSAALGVALSQRNENSRELSGGSTGLVLVGR